MDFELQPTLKGELLELRPLRADDFDDLFAVAADPLIWEQHPERDRYTEEKFRRYFEGAIRSGGAFAVIDRKSGRMIGSTRYHGYDPAAGEVEIGWTFLARSHWGGRFNRDMKRLLLEHAFRFVGRVVLLIGPDNVRSQRAAEKIGAVRTGSRAADGRESLVFEITSKNWRP
jgi:RimJ/RimL family protein N-acetyltransferase